ATDVANGVLDGADCLMLSGETSVGKYPLKVIQSMQKIISEVEAEERVYYQDIKPRRDSATYLSDAICYNSVLISKHVEATAIIGMTRSGYTAYQVSSRRPKSEIYIFTDSQQLIKQLSLLWGVHCFFYDKFNSTDGTIEDVHELLKAKGLVKKGDMVLNTGSMPIGKQGRTNMLKLSEIKSSLPNS
ncbi:MAG: pyruvate kinase, partial [Limisphaerales bacterium]